MATIIGMIKQIEKGQFFVHDSINGEMKLLKEGDSIAQDDVLFGHINNPKNAKIAVAILPLGKEIFISAKSKISFDKNFLEKIEEDMNGTDGAFVFDEESLETASGEDGVEDSTRMSAHFLEHNEHPKDSIERDKYSKNSISSFEALKNGDTNELKGIRKNSFLEDRFEIIVAKRSDNAQNQNTLAEKEDDSLTATLYVKNSDNSIQKLSELNWLSEDGLSVDISSLLDGRELLVAYTIPTTSTMTLGDLLNMTTIIQQGFSMQELPMFSLPNTGDTSINDMSAMMNSMMSMFIGSGMTTTDGMPFDMSTMSEPFMEMMNSFMSGMESMPMDEFMGMMNQMMNVMMNSGMMDTMSQMAAKMMEMMDGMMSAMPISQFGDMMGVMMDTFSEQMATSDDPFVDMANTMGSMMYSFMDGMTGNESEKPAQEFALTMGEMINQFMVGLTGGNENPAQALGDMMGGMMGSMMSGMTGDTTAPLQSFTTIMSDMMSRFMNDMSSSMVSVMDPMISMMDTMMNTMDGNMEVIASMFDTANGTMQSMISQSPLYMQTMLTLSDDIGAMADRIGDMADNIVDTQIIQSPNFLTTQANALSLIEMMMAQPSEIQSMEGFSEVMANLTSAADKMQALQDGYEIFPSNLYVQDENGLLTMVQESDLLSSDGTAVDISSFVDGKTVLVGYTIPNSTSMTLSDLFSLTKMVQLGSYSLQDLPMIPTDSGMVSVTQMSTMMNSMMGMFMGSQFASMEGMTPDMSMMTQTMDPFMEMMNSFMSGMNMDAMMPMMSSMMQSMMGVMQESGMMESMPQMAESMMSMMSTSMAAMPVESFGDMMGVMMDTFTSEILTSGNPFDNMANTMGSMMYSFMDGMTGNTSEKPAQEFALTMGEMINQFMVGLTGGNDNPAQALGDMMGSMMGSMMSGMTGDTTAPLQSFTTIMSDIMSRFMSDMSSNMTTVMDPMSDMMKTMMNTMDGNMEVIASMFYKANETAQSIIEQSPIYMDTILSLSDDIGLMADRIGDMADRIVDTQVIQSENFLATQENALLLMDMLLQNQESLIAQMGVEDFSAMMANLEKVDTVISSMNLSELSAESIFASQLYMQTSSGEMIAISETDLANLDGSIDITQFLNGNQLLVGYTIPNATSMSLNDLMRYTTLIQSGGFDMSGLPMFDLSTGSASITDMSSMMSSMMGMFMGSGFTQSGSIDTSMMDPFMAMMESFMGGMDSMPMDEFSVMMQEMMGVMSQSGMADSMMQMSDSMMGMMSGSLSAMPLDSFNAMMSTMMQSFGNSMSVGDTPMDAMAYTMGSMMLSFMEGMTGAEGDMAAHEFARTMGEMIHQFMVGVTGSSDEPAAEMGEMMGSMMGAFMTSVTGDAEDPLGTFMDVMTTMMTRFMNDFSSSAAQVMEPMADVMQVMLIGIQGNTDYISSMFAMMNETAQDMIEMSPEYMATILRLSDDIGLMADRIGEMADRIVETEVIQSANFLATQQNTMELITMLSENSSLYEPMMGESFSMVMDNLLKLQSAMDDVSSMGSMTTVVPSDLYLLNDFGEIVKMSESELYNSDGSVSIAPFLENNTMLVGYTIPLGSSMTLPELLSMTQMIEGSGFTLEQLPMFADATSIMDINSFMGSMFSADSLSMMDLPLDQFNQMIQGFESHLGSGASPMEIMGQTMGSMMYAFMSGMTQSDTAQTPLEFAKLMGEMVREFMIGVTGDESAPAGAMGEMMGSMMGSFMASITGDELTPMSSFTQTMMGSFTRLADTATANILTMMDPAQELMRTFVDGMDANMELFVSMFNTANGTIEELIERTPLYLDTMLRLSDDIGLMAGRINEMADRIVDTQVIMSENFLATQANAMELMSILNENSQFLSEMMGSDAFTGMMNTLTGAVDTLGTIAASSEPQTYTSTLYLQSSDGSLIALSSAQLMAEDGLSSDISSLLDGATLLVGYTIPTASVMSMSELINATQMMDSSTSIASLPVFASDMQIDMTDMIESMMNMMMGSAMGLSMEQSVSEPFMEIMESFVAGMGLLMEQFEGMFHAMMDTMMINDMMRTMMEMAEETMAMLHMDEFFEPSQMVAMMMDTFMADGTPMATMADMMGSMMQSFMGEISGLGANATPMDMAYSMGEMVKAFMVGVTADQENPALAMGEMMGSMMGAFMDSIVGEEEEFSVVMESMMEQMSATIMASISEISEPMNELFLSLGDGMDETIAQMYSVMQTANDTMGLMMDQSDTFVSAMTSLSEDVVQMAQSVEDMMGRVDETIALQTENFMATQQNLNTFIEMLSSSESFAMPDVLQNLETAQTLLDETLGTDYMLYGAFEPEPIMELSFMTASYEPSMEDECDTLTLEAIMTLDEDLCPLPECAIEATEPSSTTQASYLPEVCYDPTVLIPVTQDDLQHVV